MSIKVEGLTKIFGTQKAVNNLTFSIEKGNIVGFLGPNGAGKSTTMKMLTSYILPTSGKGWVNGYDIVEEPMMVKKSIGYLPEKNPLYEEMNIREYLEFCASIHQLGKLKKERVEEMIALTQLEKEVKKKIGTLSKGYRQRVGLAQALIHNPDVLILDEPTSGLDPNQIRDIRSLIVEIGKERTVLLSTHIMQEVKAMCNRVILINNGTMVLDQSLEELNQSSEEVRLLNVVFNLPPSKEFWASFDHLHSYQFLTSKNSYQLKAKDLSKLRHELIKLSSKYALEIMSMSDQGESLEDIFHQYTTENKS